MKRFLHNNQGIAAIEVAMLLPLLLLLTFAVIECGVYFVKNQIAARGVSTTANSIQNNPTHPDLQIVAKQSGLSMLDLNTEPNYICAQSYENYASAKSGLCSAGQWKTTSPDEENKPYYVAIVAYAKQKTLSGLFDGILPDIRERTVILINPSNSAILGAKAITYTPQAFQNIPASWVSAEGLNINYTPKAEAGESKIKVTFNYSLNGVSGGDCTFHIYSFKLRRGTKDVPNQRGSIHGCHTDSREEISFIIDSWGPTASTLSLMLARHGHYMAYLHKVGIYEQAYVSNMLGTASVDIVEIAN